MFKGLWGRKGKAIVYGILLSVMAKLAEKYLGLDPDTANHLTMTILGGSGLFTVATMVEDSAAKLRSGHNGNGGGT